MEFAKEVIREVIHERISYCQPTALVVPPFNNLPIETDDVETAMKEAEIYLSNGLSIAIHILLGHSNCNAKQPTHCRAAYSIEVWTLQITSQPFEESLMRQQMLPMFLKQAIRSQLYFSPTKSWFSKIANMKTVDENLSKSFRCIYKIATSSHLQAEKFSGDSLSLKIDEHKFPPCKVDNRSMLNVQVKWLKKDYFPVHVPLCPSKRTDNDLWILPDSAQFHYTDGEIPAEDTLTQNLVQNVKKSLSRQCSKELQDHQQLNNRTIVDDHFRKNTDTPLYGKSELKCKKNKSLSRKAIMRSRNKICPILREPSIKIDLNLTKSEALPPRQLKPLVCKSKEELIPSITKVIRTDDSMNDLVNIKLREKTDDNQVLRENSKENFGTVARFHYKTSGLAVLIAKDANLQYLPKPNIASSRKILNAISKQKTFDCHKLLRSSNRGKPSMGLLCNFEESALKGRLHPTHSVDGFKLQIAVNSASFSSRHFIAPVTTFYFNEDAPSLYMGNCNISNLVEQSKMGIQLSKQCILQAVLFNPQGSVVKIFLVNIDVSDMPPLSQTFIRQRTLSTSTSTPASTTPSTYSTTAPNCSTTKSPLFKSTTGSPSNFEGHTMTTGNANSQYSNIGNTTVANRIAIKEHSTLKFLIHLRLASDHKGRIFLHNDIKMLLSNKGTDLEGLVSIQTQSTTQMPQQPKYSPIK